MNYLQSLPKQQADEISQRLTMDAANQVLNDKLMRRLIAIASGEIERQQKALEDATDLEKLDAAAGADEEEEVEETSEETSEE